MPQSDNRRYFIVKHGLDAFEALPPFIWRTGEKNEPRAFRRVRVGDQWIGFAYTTSDQRERSLSLVTGFYRCTETSRYRSIPLPCKHPALGGETKAWMIEGKLCGKQPGQSVGVPSIDDLLHRRHYKGQTLVPIVAKEFEDIREYTLSHKLNPKKIPLLGREPKYEQELLAAVVCGHRRLGIEKVIRVRKAFPDLLVKLEGRAEEVHLELEVYSTGFFSHGHYHQVRKRRFAEDNKPVAILCWIDDDKDKKLNRYVEHVFELQDILRNGNKIRW